jgi:FtsP/CotA-like multicopper oxidase with cupredoxin domain
MFASLSKLFLPKEPRQHSEGCIRDLKSQEHRRVTFHATGQDDPATKLGAAWGIKTEIVREPDDVSDLHDDSGGFSNKFKVEETVDASFEQYELDSGKIDWEGVKLKHVCVRLGNKESYKQLWVIHNDTAALHNFHIHQMKFRLAKEADLTAHHINVPKQSHTCESDKCDEPDYQLYDTNPDPKLEWHDTMPVPPQRDVFLVMSFVDQKQRGRFVYHCHILKHEDKGLMAPIEVWGP